MSCGKVCCSGKKMKIKLPLPRPVAVNSNVTTQAVTATTTSLLLLTPGPFSFNSNCGRCCYGNSSINPYCISCSGLYLVTSFLTLDTAPTSGQVVTLALDLNGQNMMSYPLSSGNAIAFSTTVNLCETDKISLRIYCTSGYTGNVNGGNISITKLGERISCC